MLQISVLRFPGKGLRLPTRIRSLKVNPKIHQEFVNKEGLCDVYVEPCTNMVVAGGVTMYGK